MLSRNLFATGIVCAFVWNTAARAQLSNQQIYGATSDVHPGVVILTWDDGMDEPDIFGGLYQTTQVANTLLNQGLPGTFFMVGCHIYGQPLSLPGSSLCQQGLGDVPFQVMKAISANGFLIGNHSFSHIPLSLLTPAQIIHDFTLNQALLDTLGQKLGLNAIRCPGLDCTNVTALNGQPGLPTFKNPINEDVGGGFVADNITPIPGFPAGTGVGGDWWFYQQGLPAQMAGYYYVRDITAFGSKTGVIVLLHSRSEDMTGSDGSRNFPVNLVNYIVANTPSTFTFAPLDAIPGVLGNVQTTTPHAISREFGSNDGQGRIVGGSITGSSTQEICKARAGAVRCATWENEGAKEARELAPSTAWLTVSDPQWAQNFGSQFWLVDLNGDGRDDVVIPTSAGLAVGYSNGVDGFGALTPLLTAGNLDYRAVRFADVNNDGLPDVVSWVQGTVYVYLNNGRGFNAPIAASTDFPAASLGSDFSASTMQVMDLNGDGCADLMMREPADVFVGLSDCNGKFLPSQSWTKRFGDRQNFAMPSQNMTFSAARIAGKTGLAAGLYTGGIVFQESDAADSRFGQYRYIMDNHGFSGDPAFHPDVYASDVVFTDLFGTGNTVPVQVRPNGLYVSRIRVSKE
jgi:peptidoglycan/xylan/chitin deacetylase (PgdA/CDA1 family)